MGRYVYIVAARVVVPAPDKPELGKTGKSPVVVTRAAGVKAAEVCAFLCHLRECADEGPLSWAALDRKLDKAGTLLPIVPAADRADFIPGR